MYIDLRRCLQCGSRVRHTLPEEDIKDYQLATDGNFADTGLWFCSFKCYKDCVGKHLDKKFYFDTRVEDDPVYINTIGRS